MTTRHLIGREDELEAILVLVKLGDVLFHTEPRRSEALYRQALHEATGG